MRKRSTYGMTWLTGVDPPQWTLFITLPMDKIVFLFHVDGTFSLRDVDADASPDVPPSGYGLAHPTNVRRCSGVFFTLEISHGNP